jgi:hypothetical protein
VGWYAPLKQIKKLSIILNVVISELVDFCVAMYGKFLKPNTKCKLINILDITIRIGSKQSMVVLSLKNK